MTEAEAQEERAIKVTRAVVQEERDKFALLQPHEKEMFRVLVRDRRGVLKLSRHAYTKFYELANATGLSATEKRKLRERVKGAVAVFLQSPRVDELYLKIRRPSRSALAARGTTRARCPSSRDTRSTRSRGPPSSSSGGLAYR